MSAMSYVMGLRDELAALEGQVEKFHAYANGPYWAYTSSTDQLALMVDHQRRVARLDHLRHVLSQIDNGRAVVTSFKSR